MRVSQDLTAPCLLVPTIAATTEFAITVPASVTTSTKEKIVRTGKILVPTTALATVDVKESASVMKNSTVFHARSGFTLLMVRHQIHAVTTARVMVFVNTLSRVTVPATEVFQLVVNANHTLSDRHARAFAIQDALVMGDA